MAALNIARIPEKQYQHEYSVQDPGLTFVVEDVPTPEIVYAEDTTEALITYIYLAQDGVSFCK